MLKQMYKVAGIGQDDNEISYEMLFGNGYSELD